MADGVAVQESANTARVEREGDARAHPTGCPVQRATAPASAPTAGRSTRPIPKAPGLPIFGNMAELLVDPLAFFLKSYMTLGPVFRVEAPTRSYVVMAGMEATRFLVQEDARVFNHVPLYKNVAEELRSSHYPIATTGDRHRHLRRAVKPAFAPDALSVASRGIVESLGRRAHRWAPGTRIGALDLMHDLMGNIVIPALTGRALGGLLADAVCFARYSVGCGLGAYPVAFRYAPHYQLARRRMFPFFRDLIASHRENPPGSGRAPDFFDHMMAVEDEEGAALSEDNALALAQMIYSNTLLYVAPAATFMLHSLLSEPEAFARCRREIDEAFADGTPDLARLQRCAYFEAAKTESMRLHPIGLAAPRIVKEAFRFDGCDLPVGEAVLVAVSANHYLPEVYPSPHRFEPERHLDPRNESRVPGAFAPLGIGAHSCLAARLVDGMLALTVAGLIRHADLDFATPHYTLRKRVNPFPEPTDDFVLRVVGLRHASA